MTVRELLAKLNTDLADYMDYDVDDDWAKSPADNKPSLSDALCEAFSDTDLRISYWWNYDD